MNTLLKLLGIILILIGIFAGGCAVLLSIVARDFGPGGFNPALLAFFAVAGLAIWGGLALVRRKSDGPARGEITPSPRHPEEEEDK